VSFQLEIIGDIHSDFMERFGIPRQSGLAAAAEAELVMRPAFADPQLFEGLDQFSHVWVCFVFHAIREQGWRPRVRPPRLGGNRRLGVFATRSPYRPNHLGWSAVELVAIEQRAGVSLRLRGHDLLHGTPVLDIKPYVPYADAIPTARAGFATTQPDAALPVVFTEIAAKTLQRQPDAARLRELIGQVLSLDPRPAYRGAERSGEYGVQLAGMEVRWRHDGDGVVVTELLPPDQ
jgi:tRNA-Thr(GGU) m(6)t(6)A37 methyltransferase TsaA